MKFDFAGIVQHTPSLLHFNTTVFPNVTLAEFKRSISVAGPPPGLSIPLQGLWYAAKGGWDKAHRTVQDDSSRESAWVHAHLHKQEGDHSNAGYWYAKSPKNTSGLTPEAEWEEIARTLLKV